MATIMNQCTTWLGGEFGCGWQAGRQCLLTNGHPGDHMYEEEEEGPLLDADGSPVVHRGSVHDEIAQLKSERDNAVRMSKAADADRVRQQAGRRQQARVSAKLRRELEELQGEAEGLRAALKAVASPAPLAIEDRIAAWRGEEGGREEENVVPLLCDAEDEIRSLRARLEEALSVVP